MQTPHYTLCCKTSLWPTLLIVGSRSSLAKSSYRVYADPVYTPRPWKPHAAAESKPRSRCRLIIRPTRHKCRSFRRVLPSQSLGLVLETALCQEAWRMVGVKTANMWPRRVIIVSPITARWVGLLGSRNFVSQTCLRFSNSLTFR